MFIIKIFYAIFGIAMGVSILKYRKIVYSWTGKFYWAEKYLGNGGTIFVIILIGLGFIFVSVAYPFWVFDDRLPKDTPGSSTQQTNSSPLEISK